MMRDIAERIAWHFLGTPYLWGGDDPSGYDCSGFVIEILKSVGILPGKGDWTADGLWRMFKDQEVPSPARGYLAFWFNDAGRAIHVEFCLDDKLSIGASGGGRNVKTFADAYRKNAYVKIRPIASRRGWVRFVNPFK